MGVDTPAGAPSAEPRRMLARVLQEMPGPWSEVEVRQVHRLLRDSASGVWQVACRATAARAGREPGARRELLGLLASASEEIRLRGLVALGELPGDEAVPFLLARRDEAAALGDAALLDAVATALAALDPEAFATLVDDPRDLVRAAAAAHLPPSLAGAAEGLARDPSPRVRVALATAASAGLAEAALWLLASDADPVVRQALAEELPREEAASLPFLEILQRDPDPLVQAAARPDRSEPRPLPPAGEPSEVWSRVRSLEARLDAAPGRCLETLRPELDTEGSRGVLDRLSQVARDPDLAALCRALAVLQPLPGVPRSAGRELVLQALGSLPAEPAQEAVAAFRRLLATGLRAAEASSPEAVREWARQVEPVAGPPGALLRRMGRIAASLEPITCTTLSQAASALEEVRLDLERDCLDPERALLRLAVESWSETVEESIAEMLTGAKR